MDLKEFNETFVKGVGVPLAKVFPGASFPALQPPPGSSAAESESSLSDSKVLILPIVSGGCMECAIFTPDGNAYYFVGINALPAPPGDWFGFAARHYFWVFRTPEDMASLALPSVPKHKRFVSKFIKNNPSVARLDLFGLLTLANQVLGPDLKAPSSENEAEPAVDENLCLELF